MKFRAKEIGIGTVVGLLANIAGIYLYIYFFSDYSLEETLELAVQNNFMASLIVLGAILNLFVFFIYLRKRQYYRARGVVFATFAAALAVLILKII